MVIDKFHPVRADRTGKPCLLAKSVAPCQRGPVIIQILPAGAHNDRVFHVPQHIELFDLCRNLPLIVQLNGIVDVRVVHAVIHSVDNILIRNHNAHHIAQLFKIIVGQVNVGLHDPPAVRVALLLVPLTVVVQHQHTEARNNPAEGKGKSDHQFLPQRQAHAHHPLSLQL